MIVADRGDSNSEIQRRQDVYDQFINKEFILKVIRNLYAIPPSLLVFIVLFVPFPYLRSLRFSV